MPLQNIDICSKTTGGIRVLQGAAIKTSARARARAGARTDGSSCMLTMYTLS